MTILRFYNINKKHLVGVNDTTPIVQNSGGCTNMFDSAKLYDGIFISDEKIKGWWTGEAASCYFHGQAPNFGTIVSGSIRKEMADVVGFKIPSDKLWWRTGNACWRMTEEDFNNYYNGTDTEKKEILKKYPDPIVVVEKKPRKVKEPPVEVKKDEVPV